MATRTATFNRIRGLLAEFGVVLPLKAATVRREALAVLEDLPGWANTVIGGLLSELQRGASASYRRLPTALSQWHTGCPYSV